MFGSPGSPGHLAQRRSGAGWCRVDPTGPFTDARSVGLRPASARMEGRPGAALSGARLRFGSPLGSGEAKVLAEVQGWAGRRGARRHGAGGNGAESEPLVAHRQDRPGLLLAEQRG